MKDKKEYQTLKTTGETSARDQQMVESVQPSSGQRRIPARHRHPPRWTHSAQGALRAAVPGNVKRILARLGVEVRKPSLFSSLPLHGVVVEPFRDPVLSTLAEFPDQREYFAMWRLPEIFDPWRHMTSSIFSAPLEIQAGR